MAKKKKEIKVKEPVRIREKVLGDGTISLYLDMYHKGNRKKEGLKLYIIPETTPAAKLQNVSESVFDLCLLQVFDMIDADKAGRGRAGLYGMIRECKWAIVALAAIVCGMLAFRPELAGLISTLAGKG